MTSNDLMTDLRRLLADERCLCSSAHTDWHGVAALLDHLEATEAQLTAARSALAAVREVRAAQVGEQRVDWARLHHGICPKCGEDKFIGHGPQVEEQ